MVYAGAATSGASSVDGQQADAIASASQLQERKFTFGPHTLTVACRKMPEQVARVTQTLQLDVDELFEQLLTWGSDGSESEDEAVAAAAAQQQQQHSKKICGNVAEDQPDLIGLDVWPAAITLCTYLAAHPHLASGATVMELGAGVGLPGLLTAKQGATSVLLTDYEPIVVEQQRANAALCGVTSSCSFMALDWFDPSVLGPEQRSAVKLLLLADVIYAAAVVQGLVDTMQAVLHPQGIALVAHRIRRPLTFDRKERVARLQERDEIFEAFKMACSAAGLQLREISSRRLGTEDGSEPQLWGVAADAELLVALPLANGAADDVASLRQAAAATAAVDAENV